MNGILGYCWHPRFKFGRIITKYICSAVGEKETEKRGARQTA